MGVINPFDDLYRECNTGTAYEKWVTERGPIIVDVEPTSLCNFRCKFCPTGLQGVGRAGNYMTVATFSQILKLTKPMNSAIRFIGWGEPLLNPEALTMMHLAKAHGRLVHLNTNASLMCGDGRDTVTVNDFISASCHSVKISMQGATREKFHIMRGTDNFDHCLHVAHNLRWRIGTRPFVAISCTTTDETDEEIQEFVSKASICADRVTVGATMTSFIRADKVPARRLPDLERVRTEEQTTGLKHPDPCPEVYDKLSIHWDGSAVVCCNDYYGETNLGNVNDVESIDPIYYHDTMVEYRKNLACGIYTGPLCENCYEYIETEKTLEADIPDAVERD